MERLGTPGGGSFGYLVVLHNTVETIVYATSMNEALVIYRERFSQEPYSIRQMADNE